HAENAAKLWFVGVSGLSGWVSALAPFTVSLMDSHPILSSCALIFGVFLPFIVFLFFGKKGLLAISIAMIFLIFAKFEIGSIINYVKIYWPVLVFMYIFMGIFAIHYSWKTMKFVTVATHVFKELGLENPSSVDLPKRSKMNPLPIPPVAAKAPPSKSAIAKAAKDAAAAKALTPKAAAKKAAKDKANAEYAAHLAAHAAETEGPVKPSASVAFGNMYFRY
ncbi:MAG: hypothetical protein K2Q15_04785, partial [Burkholderiales bacterium]|nr:hypothetical protein [Burkholderiales bacterium]